MSEIEQVPDELASLFAAERTAPVVDAATRAAAKARMVAAVAHVPLGTAGAAGTATALAGTGKVIAILVVTLGVGAGTIALVKHTDRTAPGAPTETRRPEARAVVPAPAVEPSPVESAPPPPIEHAPPVTQAPRSVASRPVEKQAAPVSETPTTVPETAPANESSPSQAQLLRRAWAALNTGAATEALAIVRDDVRLHPDGVLTEERAALNVLALAKLGRRDEARAASRAFASRYPTSIHRARIDRALEEKP